jgi:hypothetical protein
MMKAFANLTPFNFILSMNEKWYPMTLTGVGFQFSRTPSMIKTFFFAGSQVKVNGSGPANLLASFQLENGEPAGKEIFSPAKSSIRILKPDLFDMISVVPFCLF